MRRASTVVFLLATLLASNAWWLYNAIDIGITRSYAAQTCIEHAEASAQAIAALPAAARLDASRDSVVAAARRSADVMVYDKDGLTWVGRLGLRFDAKGRLVEVQR